MKKAKFLRRFQKRIPARWHMSFICFITIAVGIIFSKSLLYFQIPAPMIRYGLSVIFAYGIFFLCIYIWLRLHFVTSGSSKKGRKLSDATDTLDLVDTSDGISNTVPSERWIGSGGRFSGAGANDSWSPSLSGMSSSSGAKSSLLSGLDADDGGAIILLVVALVAVIFGSATYIVFQAPEILFEAAFEGLVVAGAFKRAKRIKSEGWKYSIFKKTWIPFAVVLAISVSLGYYLKSTCPDAISFAEFKTLCWKK